MEVYQLLFKLLTVRKYPLKFLSFVIVIINVPLILILALTYFTDFKIIPPGALVFVVLILTAISTSSTLIILYSLIKPFFLVKDYLYNYIHNNKIGELPKFYKDEIGTFMSDITSTIMSLDELMKEKQDLIALMSHDLKNPLSAVITYTGMLEVDNKNKLIINKILNAANSQNEIINTVLKMLENDSMFVMLDEFDEVNINELLLQLKDRYKKKLIDKNIEVKIQINSKNIWGNNNLIYQVFDNLFSNSLKFTENGIIYIRTEDTEDNYINITFTDSGIGFEKDIANKLFDRFTTYKRKGTNGESTTGLGLYLTKKIITRHFGTIEAHSEGKDMGSTFIVKLPAVE